MGFWGDLWNGIKSVGTSIYNTVRKPVDWIVGAGDKIAKIPVIGGPLSTFLSPVTGLARTVQGGLNTVRDVAEVGKTIGLQKGGIVPMKKVFQAE